MHLRNLQNTDPFEGAQEENVCLEDVLGLPTDPDDYYEDTDMIINGSNAKDYKRPFV